MSARPYIVLHGGFHKTATSHIQSMLARNSKMLERAGVHYVHHRKTRKEVTIPVQCNAYIKLGIGWDPKIYDEELSAMTGAFFADILENRPRRIILSDENLAGHCGHCVRFGKLYRWGETLMQVFGMQVPSGPDEVHFGLRNYADFFSSAYVEYLRSVSGQWFIDERHMRRAVTARMPNWHKVLDTAKKAFPTAKVHAWRYEDFRQLDLAILGNLCGPDIDVTKLKEPKDKNKRPTASGRAVRELLQMIHKDGADAALSRRVEIQERYPRGKEYGGYDPWTRCEREHLTRIYERDVRAIEADPDITFLRPAQGEMRKAV
ncbi:MULTISPECIES: hypothetical protein [unclassified Roseovarius]|uniref:hypothetical protein n=1 Tax=unclassified Roseovarius TaxID=2614913 RepID=UPI00273EDE32|nr:hypothetical protein [Roseovarius sp. MMSF_3350]